MIKNMKYLNFSWFFINLFAILDLAISQPIMDAPLKQTSWLIQTGITDIASSSNKCNSIGLDSDITFKDTGFTEAPTIIFSIMSFYVGPDYYQSKLADVQI